VPKRVEAVRAAFSMTRAAQNMLLLLTAEERCVTQPAAVQLAIACFARALRPLAHSHDGVGAAAAMAISPPEQPRAWPGRLWPPSGGRQPRREEELLGFTGRASGI